MSKKIGNSVWPLKNQTNPPKSLDSWAWNSVKYPWSLREMRCLPVKCGVYPWNAMFTRGKSNPMPPLEYNVFLCFFLFFFNQSGHPDANRIQFLDWPLSRTPLPWCLLFTRLSLGASRAKHPLSCKHICIVEWKQNNILWEILCQMWFKVISHEFD